MENERIIESIQNPRVKSVVKLRKAKVRNETGRTLVEGFREIQRAVDSGWKFTELYYCPELYLHDDENKLVQLIGNSGIPAFRCSPAAFEKMSYRDSPDGLLAVSPLVGRPLEDLDIGKAPLILVAEYLEKPGNLGTMLRTADATGVDAVIVCDPKTDCNNPNVIRASIGSLFFVPVTMATKEQALAWLRDNNIQSIAAVPGTDQVYTDVDMTKGSAIFVGSEDQGLSDALVEAVDRKVSIPMLGRNDSLNVSTAAAVILYEAVRQRHIPR